MSCDCETYICTKAFINPCNVGTFIGIEATETGTWTARLGFNNTFREFGISVDDGKEIAIPTELLNENYQHDLKLYDSNGILINCYKLQTHLTFSVADTDIPSPIFSYWTWGSVVATGNIIYSDLFKGKISPIIWIDGNSLDWIAQGITHDPVSGELDFTAIGGVNGSLSFQYKLLI